MEKEICSAQCLTGKCPFGSCINYRSRGENAHWTAPEGMQILTDADIQVAQRADGFGVAVDIGTTTVAVYLWNREKGECVACASEMNAQAPKGVDVLSRIRYCADNADGRGQLHGTITRQLDRMISSLARKETVLLKDIKFAVFTGNTTMLHLLAGLSPVSMGQLPFRPASQFGVAKPAGEIGLASLSCDVYLPGCPGAFVGADIVTAMLAAGFDRKQETLLLMDIGTNGEMALLHDGKIHATSTAAGPAFEGAELSCGMAGVTGAISSVYAREGIIEYDVIGGGEAAGMCGSGVLDFTSLMVEAGAIDDTGAIIPGNPFLLSIEGGAVLALNKTVYLTQKDIRSIQAAKAAMAAGIFALSKAAGISLEQIDQTFIAGGFGNYMNIDSARRIGLVPPGIGNVANIGNAAAAGAALLLFPKEYKTTADWLFCETACVDLGGDAYFTEKYVANIYF